MAGCCLCTNCQESIVKCQEELTRPLRCARVCFIAAELAMLMQVHEHRHHR